MLRKSPFPGLDRIIQYWFFYRYDDWQNTAFGGTLVQRHDGDWEHVTVGFSAEEPLFAAYSSHCGGQWYRWSNIRASRGIREGAQWNLIGPATHPFVAVAKGSHAGYSDAWKGRAPDWAGCEDLPGAAVAALSYAANIRDVTNEGEVIRPNQILYVTRFKWPMSFPGYWSGGDKIYFRTRTGGERVLGKGTGPASPPLQPAWSNPIETIFHTDAWSEGK